MRWVAACCLACCVIVCLSARSVIASENVWVGGVSNDWIEPANWSLGSVPEPMTDATFIDRDPLVDSEVTLAWPASVADLTLDAGDSLTMSSGTATLQHSGVFALNGELRLEDNARLTDAGPLLIGETGRVVVTPRDAVIPATLAGGPHLRHNLGVIEGAGAILNNNLFINGGQIVANLPGEQLVFRTSNGPAEVQLTNAGLLRAENGGALLIEDGGPTSQLRNYASGALGRIEAGPNSLVDLSVTVVGGQLAADPDQGRIAARGIQDVRVEGTLHLYGPFAGQIENTGQIIHGEATQLVSDATLTGGGEFVLGDPSLGASFNFLQINPGASGLVRLTNEDNQISGRGTVRIFGGQFTNRGVVNAGFGPDAVAPGGVLAVTFENASGDPVVNSGVLRAGGSGRTLRLEGDSFNGAELQNFEGSTPGVIEATGGGRVVLGRGVVIHGGIVRTDAQYQPSEPPTGPASQVVAEFGSQPVVLDSVRLEGHVGEHAGQIALRGRIENTGVLETQTLYVGRNLELSGGGMLVLAEGGRIDVDQSRTSFDAVITNRDNTLRLYSNSPSGGARVVLDNHGVVESVASAGQSYAPGQSITNQGLLVARAGSTLLLPPVESPLGATAARVHAETGGVVTASAIRGGLLTTDPGADEASPGGLIRLAGSLGDLDGALRDVTNEGHVEFFSGTMVGDITNNATIELTGSVSLSVLPTTLSGDGELQLNGRLLNGPRSTGTGLLTNAAGHRIAGVGGLSAYRYNIVNHGEIVADSPGGLEISLGLSSYFLQSGRLAGEGDGYFVVETQGTFFTNRGLIDAASSGNHIAAPWTINASGATIQLSGDLTANFLNNHSGAAITGHGELLLNDNNYYFASLDNAGLIAPDAGSEELFVQGGVRQSATGELRIVVDGLSSSDLYSVLRVSQLSTLGGTLGFDFDDGVTPAYGDAITFLLGSTEGVFDAVTGLPELADGLAWAIDYQPYQVTAVVALPGDFNLDGVVDAADYTVWRDNPRGQYAASDLAAWTANHGLTAPSAPPANVPEPGALWLLAAVLAMAHRPAARR